MELARLVGLLINDGFLPPSDEQTLCAAVDRPIEELRARLTLESGDGEVDAEDTGTGGPDQDAPDIFFTSLVGAKGLSAEHVSIVGLNNGHLPSRAGAIAEDEICAFLVALSRTCKRCHLISYRFAFSGGLQRSVFLDWIARHVAVVTVDKDYDFDP